MMESASPTASASTNRGGRPKDWTEPRTRRLIRLYLFTTLPFPKILELLEEDEFKPGKDAANKVKNSVLGNDPRWIRPKDEQEEKARIRGLRNSLRGRRSRQDTPSHDLNGAASEENGSFGGTTIAHSYRSSIDELQHPGSASFAYSGTNTDIFTPAPDDASSSRFIPSLIGRLTTSRQDTGLTTSTDISVTSVLREKLSFLTLDRAKRTVKVLKRYTFPKNLESQRAPDVLSSPFQDPEFYSPADRIDGLSNAKYAVPGDFLNAELFAHQRQCASESPAHPAGVCWCKVHEQVSPTRNMWASLNVSSHMSDPALTVKDMRVSARFPGQPSDICRINRRDAFGMKPMDTRSSPDTKYAAAHIQAAQEASTKNPAAFTRPVPRINTQTGTVEDKELYVHADLLRVVLTAVGVDQTFSPNAQNEDSQGRNGFHCLAEVDFCLSPGTPKPGSRGHLKDDSKPTPQGQNKRRHNEGEEIETPRTASDSRRLECVDGLIDAKVDANQYDKHGNTPLMSFVVNSSDATKCEKEECEIIVRALVQKAGARIELRNRNGETALHLAARYGKTVALRVLLDLGANPHTRNGQGLSILEVLDNLYVTTERDDKNNARFEACRAILTRSKDYAKQSPTLIDEWHMR
ncbi:hypothetical protein E0Z10_g9912 [Xylaria hypoxylon]|uniref:Uncharacterized protein n=1 Tax=Xylaria hypoxylon TaxID=37992 RepID=A0A4Z0YQJ3_9PEZI|nr:hypothetical protein E0Z10_g9912 [Xylaria hypoxylon]